MYCSCCDLDSTYFTFIIFTNYSLTFLLNNSLFALDTNRSLPTLRTSRAISRTLSPTWAPTSTSSPSSTNTSSPPMMAARTAFSSLPPLTRPRTSSSPPTRYATTGH